MSTLRENRTSRLDWIKKLLLQPYPVFLIYCSFLTLAHAEEKPHRQLSIRLERAPETSRDTLTLKATITNTSQQKVTIILENPLIDYVLTVRDSRGNAIPLSNYGKELRSKEDILVSRSLMVTLHPGEQNTETWIIDKMFELVRPGRYRVSVKRDFPAIHESDSSNILEIILE